MNRLDFIKEIKMAEVIGTQCRNVIYLANNAAKNAVLSEKIGNRETDVHLVKITDYLDDGTVDRKIKLIKNFKKTFWVCTPKNRNHKQKKERFLISECEEIRVPRKEMLSAAMNSLGIKNFGQRISPSDILRGPYVYGTDLSSSAELKYKYNHGELASKTEKLADVAAFDVETNIRNKEKYEHIEMATLSMKDIVVTVVDINFIRGKFPNISKEKALETLYKYDEIYLGEVNKERNIKQEFYVVDSEIEVVKKIFERAHEIKPDFISAWNMGYDVRRTIEACERADVKVSDILSDPSVPPAFRFFDYNPGKESALSKKGVWKNLANFEKWPQVNVPASFTFIDSMCYYYNSRKHKGKLPKYSLDYILSIEFPDEIKPGMSEKEIARANRNSKIRKLKFDESSHLIGTVDWHIFMQSNYPFEYVIYNKFDCIALEYLDEQTMDISHSIVSACESSDYKDFDSEPKRLADDMHWFNLERGYAYGTGGANNEIPLDSELIGRDDWIITLRADLLIAEGNNLFEDARGLKTLVFRDNADIDVTSSYPNGNSALNTSRETMTKELISIDNVDERWRRQSGINMSGGFVNAVEISCQLFNAPTMVNMLEEYRRQKNN